KISARKPIPLKTPDATSMIERIVNNSGTSPASGLFVKWPFSQLRFPCRSTILSTPDCKNKIARNAETRSWSKYQTMLPSLCIQASYHDLVAKIDNEEVDPPSPRLRRGKQGLTRF